MVKRTKQSGGKNGKGRRKLKKVNKFLRDTKILSKIGTALNNAGVPYAGDIGGLADQLGYGRKRAGKRVVKF